MIGVLVCGLIIFIVGLNVVRANEKLIPFRTYTVSHYVIVRFIDPDNGNICYVDSLGNEGGISCLRY